MAVLISSLGNCFLSKAKDDSVSSTKINFLHEILVFGKYSEKKNFIKFQIVQDVQKLVSENILKNEFEKWSIRTSSLFLL